MDSLESATIWIFVTLLIVVLASFRKNDDLEFVSFKIPRKYAGPILYSMMIGLNFQVLKLFHNVNSIVQELKLNYSKETFIAGKTLINSHPWVFNPFSEFSTETSILFDNLGYALLIVLWWLGNAAAYKLMFRESKTIKLIGIGLASIYLILGLSSMWIIQTTTVVVTESPLKVIMPLIGIGLGALVFSGLMYPLRKELRKKEEQEKKEFDEWKNQKEKVDNNA